MQFVDVPIQSWMTLTDMRLTEFMGLTEKSAMTKHGFKGMQNFKGNFPYDDLFRKTHARLYSRFIIQNHLTYILTKNM